MKTTISDARVFRRVQCPDITPGEAFFANCAGDIAYSTAAVVRSATLRVLASYKFTDKQGDVLIAGVKAMAAVAHYLERRRPLR